MNVIVADDHALFRDGVVRILKSLAEDIHVFEAGDAGELFRFLEKPLKFAVILVDLGMPGIDGVATILEIKKKAQSPVVVVSGKEENQEIVTLLNNGISGFIPKTVKGEILLGALRLVMSGGRYIPENVLLTSETSDNPAHGLHITPRQREVLTLVAEGKSNREVATELNISEYTVRIHVAALLKQMDARNRTHMVAVARERGLVRE